MNSISNFGIQVKGLSDPMVLETAARENRILVSHDKRSMPVHFAARIGSGLKSPGVLLASQSVSVGEIVESVLTVWSASDASDWAGQIHYLPSLSPQVLR